RSVHELLDPRELDDVRVLALDLAPAHAENRAVEVDVLAAGELRVEPGADLEEAADPPADLGAAAGGRRDPGQDLEKGGLAGAVAADHAQHFTLPDGKGDPVQGPDVARLAIFILAAPDHALSARGERVAQRVVGGVVLTDPVALREPLDCDGDAHQILSAKPG